MDFVKYTTVEGDRLDTIAFKVYGNPHQWDEIIEDNPTLDLQGRYEGGINLKIRIIPGQETGIQNLNLPPWKR